MPETNPNAALAAEGTEPKPATPIPDGVAGAALSADLQARDSTPTIISKTIPKPGPAGFQFAEPLRGKQLAHFELLEAVGVGGMAAVIKARDLQLERFVALKVLPPEMAQDAECVNRFHQEARSAARLDHENIARVFYCGQDQSLHFIAFEYVEGENLRNIVDRRERLPVREAVHYMLQVAAGLAHAAARGVVHRDIKPSNIIITPTGRAKLVDMGLARSLEQPFDRGLTHSGVTLGTFDYISPEQAEEPRNADVRSDIYSLGCTFYHVLTGQPPVPEGTAAKKLKHHQAVAPIDPRQLNAEIPDDVTAILARMMAKDPKDRYQRAEQLVQHLIMVAQRVGASTSVPEGPLYVDAALPQPPRARPLLVGLAAAVALVVVVLVIGQLSRPTGPSRDGFQLTFGGSGSGTRSAEPGSAPERGSKSSGESFVKGDVAPPKQAVAYDGEFSVRALAAFLGDVKSDAEAIVELPAGELDLSEAQADGRPVFAFHGRKLTLQSKDPANPVTIRLSEMASATSTKRLAALEADCDELVLKNVRFVVTSEAAKVSLACVVVRGTRKCQIEQCQFVLAQPGGQGEKQHSAAVVVDGRRDNTRPNVSLLYCSFLAADAFQPVASADDATLTGMERCGTDAVLLQCACKLDVAQCAFGPHSALFHADGAFTDQVAIKCTSCTGLLAGEGSVFLLDNGIPASLALRHNLFGRASLDFAETADDKQLVLLRQADEPGDVTFKGEDNHYYRLDAFWVRQGERTASLMEGDSSAVQKDRPWKKENPLKLLEHPSRIREAFQLDDARAELRQKDAPLKLVGIDHLPGARSYNSDLVAVVEKKPSLIVDPTITKSANGTYPSLATALRESRPGDQILIRHGQKSNVLKESLILLDRPDLDVVISPEKGFQPVLMLEESSLDSEPALFRVHKGKILFEHMEFVLQPQTTGDSISQALFALIGDCQVTFKNCAFTLDRTQRSIPLAAIRIDELLKDGKPLPRPEGRPVLRFEDCLVRAQGDLVKARGNQPLELSLTNSLLAISGNLLNLESVPQTLAGPTVRLKMDRVTACLGNNLLRLQQQGKDVRGIIPMHAEPISDCLFIAVHGSPLVFLDGVAAGEDRMNKLFTWEGRNNAYVNFTRMLNQATNDDAMAMLYCEPKDWEKIYEKNARFPKSPSTEALDKLLPLQLKFRPEIDWKGFGVPDLDVLPRPHWLADKATSPED